jgi:hypothetical protein
MSQDRTASRRYQRRKFKPTVDGLRLETRELLSAPGVAKLTQAHFLLTHPQPGFAFNLGDPPQRKGSKAFPFDHGPKFNQGVVAVQVIRGGYGVVVAQPDGSRFRLTLSLADTQFDGGLTAQTGSTSTLVVPSTVTQPTGTIRAYPMPGGKVGLILDGTTENMQLVIDPLPQTQRRGYAHSFSYGQSGRSHVLNIGSINVTSGKINAILGFHSASLSGPLAVGGAGLVDRIAFDSLQPGAVIGVGGTLNTLDIANDVNLTTGPGISVGKDLNLLNIGGNLNLSNGASLRIGRFIGLTPQPPKGTSTGSNFLALNQAQVGTGLATLVPGLSAYIQGSVNLGTGSVIAIASGIASSSVSNSGSTSPSVFLINGSLTGTSAVLQLQIPGLVPFNKFAPTVNFVARNGFNIPPLLAGPGV